MPGAGGRAKQNQLVQYKPLRASPSSPVARSTDPISVARSRPIASAGLQDMVRAAALNMSPPEVEKLVENCMSKCGKPCPARLPAGLPVEEAAGYIRMQQLQRRV
jgi:hypothetical protein